MMWIRLSWVAAAAVYVVLLPAGNAFGHAAFRRVQPAPGVRLEVAPQRVVLAFTEPLNRRLRRAMLVRADGERVAIEVQAASERRLVLRSAGLLDRGAYRLQAPNRIALATGAKPRSVRIGRARWYRTKERRGREVPVSRSR